MDQKVGLSCHILTKAFIHIMKVAPPRTILSSATLPSRDEMPVFYDQIARKYASNKTDINIKSFTSSDFQVGCNLFYGNSYFVPHKICGNCNNVCGLMENGSPPKHYDVFKKTMKILPSYERFYSQDLVKQMIIEARNYGISDAFIINTQHDAQVTAIKIIKTLKDSDKFRQFIEKIYVNHDFIEEPVSLESMMTTHKVKFSSGTLEIIDKIFPKKKDFNPITSYRSYIENTKQMANRRERFSRNITDEKEQSDFMNSDSSAIWTFETGYQLMSIKHVGNKSGGANLAPDELADLVDEYEKNPWIIKLLCHGVGIYSTRYPLLLTKSYLDKIVYLSKRDVIRIIISDGSIAYGTNLSFSNMLLYENPLINKHSIKTLLQLFGRVGRSGLSTSANIHIINSTATHTDSSQHSKLFEKLYNPLSSEGDHDEIENLNLGLRYEWHEIIGDSAIDRFSFFASELSSRCQ